MNIPTKKLIFISSTIASCVASSAPVIHTSLASWENILGNPTVQIESFDTDVVITEAPTSVGLFDVSVGSLGATPTEVTEGQLTARMGDTFNPYSVTFEFDGSISGFGGNFISTLTGSGIDIRINSLNSTQYEFSDFLSFPGDGFFGITDLDNPITSVHFGLNTLVVDDGFGGIFVIDNETWSLDNVRLAASITAVPLPASILLFASPLACFLVLKKSNS